MPDTAISEVTEIDFAQPLPDDMKIPAVAQHQPPMVPVSTGGDPFLAMIERAATDPRVDIDKMERLLQMKERRDAQEARVEFDRAMVAAQGEMRAIRADLENPQTRSKYASYAQLDKAIRPIYSRHGFAVSFNTGDAPRDNELRVLATLSHAGGHRQDYRIDMPADGKGARGNDVMTKTHATGAAASYGQRYLYKLMFNLAVGDVDDDGNGAGYNDDIERLGTGPRNPDGSRMSNYNAKAAEKAKEWADDAIQAINHGTAESAREWRRVAQTVPQGKKKSPLQWLEDNSPGQFTRVANAYQNVTGDELE